MPIPLDEQRPYDRLKHTQDERQYLRQRGFRPVVSSNVSAVARDGAKLIVRFHGGNTYVYPNSGDRFQDFMNAYSKGKWVWSELRRKGVPYRRVGSYNIPDDVESRDIMRPDEETDVQIESLANEQARAQVVSVEQAQGKETIIDIEDAQRQQPRPEPIDTSALGLLGLDDVLGTGIIAGLLLASMIDDGNAADNAE